MTPGTFADRARRPGVGLADLATALAAEFRPVDQVGVAHDVAALALELRGADRLPIPGQLESLAAVMRAFRPRADALSRRPLMVDSVLRDEAGHPLVLALLATEIGRQAGLDVAVGDAGGEIVVGHRRWTRPFVLTFEPPAARVTRLHEPALTWRCPHQVMRLLLSELLERARRAGDVSVAIHAAELRLALPLDRRSRLAMRAELARIRATLN